MVGVKRFFFGAQNSSGCFQFMADYFSIMPVEIFMDDRLSKTDIRVLGAIMSWRNKDTNLCHPSRDQISERCGLPASKISTATTRLVELGWLKKTGNGGRSMRCNYQFCVPDLTIETVPESVTVTESVTVPKSVTKTVPDSVTKTVPESGRGKKLKETKNKLKEITLTEFLIQCKQNNESAIPENDPVFEYATKVCIPADFLHLGWLQFKFLQNPDKKQKDWRAVFRNYVKLNYLKVWFIDNEGKYCLTTLGKQLEREVA